MYHTFFIMFKNVTVKLFTLLGWGVGSKGSVYRIPKIQEIDQWLNSDGTDMGTLRNYHTQQMCGNNKGMKWSKEKCVNCLNECTQIGTRSTGVQRK